MKKMRKKVLGLISLALVIAMTFFAAGLPGPKASAATTVTDTIILRVIGTEPNIDITSPANDEIFVSPSTSVNFNYENVETVTVELVYTDLDGVEHDLGVVATYNPDYAPGSESYNLDLGAYGYGEFLVKVTGTGHGGIFDIGLTKFNYTSIYTDVEEDPNTGLTYLNLHYDPTIVGTLDVEIYSENGDLITPQSPIHVAAPTNRIELPMAGLPGGQYTIKTTAFSAATGLKIGDTYTNTYRYEPTPAPDTGSFFIDTNISKEDYLITGLIAFLGFSFIAIWVVAKDRKNKR